MLCYIPPYHILPHTSHLKEQVPFRKGMQYAKAVWGLDTPVKINLKSTRVQVQEYKYKHKTCWLSCGWPCSLEHFAIQSASSWLTVVL